MTEEIKKFLTNRLIPILEIESDELLKWCIENNHKIGISSIGIKNLILEIGDIPYIKSCIENPNITLSSGGKTSLILKLGLIDPMFKDKNEYEKYIKQCIENSSLGLVSGDICDLLKEINDDGYKKKYIYNNKKLYLDSICMKYVIADLLLNYDINKVFIQTVILDEEIPFEKRDRVELIAKTGDKKFIKQFLTSENDILGDKYSAERTYLAILFGDNNILKEHINMLQNFMSMNIPKNLTYGVELEAESSIEDGDSNYYRTELLERSEDFDESFYQPYKYLLDWKIKDEYSMINGIEFTSPILKNTYEDIESIYRMTTLMKQLRLHPTESCGGHIHIGADYFDCVEDYKNLFEIWANSEKILYLISNKEGEYPREGVMEYAKPITREKTKEIENEFTKKDVFIENAKEKQKDNKHYSLNILNIGRRFNKNTIEFRMPNGSLEPEIILQNITLYARIMQVSKELTKITNKIKNGKQITKDEKQKIIYKEMLKREIPDDDNMKILMKLLFDDKEERTVYEKRYYANKDLFSYMDSIRGTKFPKLDYEQLNDKDIMQEVENYSKNYENR